MAIYNTFAKCYDAFMAETPYGDWVRYVQAIFVKFNIQPKLVLELACGTGSITARLAAKGYDMIGLDKSAEMLAVAAAKSAGSILYTCQDMRSFELYGTVDCALCLCDGMNYITNPNDLLCVFKLVKNYLNPGGLFIFDLNTLYKFERVLASNSFSKTTKNAAYYWDNFYDKTRRLNKYTVTFRGEHSDWHEEIHIQRAYGIDEIKRVAEAAGFRKGYAYDMDKPVINGLPVFMPPRKTTQRVCIVLEG